MEFDEVLRRRRMVRTYDPDRPVPPELVDKLIRHALRAPSAGFSQGWGFLVLSEPADRELYWSVTAPRGDTPAEQAAAGPRPDREIGRASCRERAYGSGGGATLRTLERT